MNQLPNAIPLTDGALLALRKTGSWVLFLGVISIIAAVFGGIMVLASPFVLHKAPASGFLYLIEGGILLVAAILFAVWLLGYSGALRRVAQGAEATNAALERALLKQRNLWIGTGVVMIIVVLLGIAIWIFWAIWGQHFFANLPTYSS
ncbi:MAG: hypothetical protein ACRER1_07975 [Gammaproteobacteria bacterium]